VISSEGSRLGEQAARRLAQIGRCEIGPGLTDAELARIEREYELEFADDHRAFLSAGLPFSAPREKDQTCRQPWPDWRDGDPSDLRGGSNVDTAAHGSILERVPLVEGQYH
jgi:hypothetical protein